MVIVEHLNELLILVIDIFTKEENSNNIENEIEQNSDPNKIDPKTSILPTRTLIRLKIANSSSNNPTNNFK